MSSVFDLHLKEIASSIKSPGNYPDIDDFVIVKGYVLDILRAQDAFFRKICQSDMIYGSALHGIRVYDDDEFDVILELSFPFYEQIVARDDKNRCGFVHLDFSNASFSDVDAPQLLQNNILSRTSLKQWLHGIFLDAFAKFGCTVYGKEQKYELTYSWRGIKHVVCAQSSSRRFSIDFVPAVEILLEHSADHIWHAIPKAMNGPANTAEYTFLLSNTKTELQLLNIGGHVVKDALRLLQALCIAYNLPKLRCFHMVTLAIGRIVNDDLDCSSLSNVFLELLSDLCDYIADGHLPYMWEDQLNLLNNIHEQELCTYETELDAIYTTLQSYPHQASLSYKCCLKHFN